MNEIQNTKQKKVISVWFDRIFSVASLSVLLNGSRKKRDERQILNHKVTFFCKNYSN